MTAADPSEWLKGWERRTLTVPLQKEELEGATQCCIYDGDPLPPNKHPIKVPVRRDREGNMIYCGVACSFACAYAFIEANPSIFNDRSVPLLKDIAADMYNIHQPLIKARPIFSLKKYGGYLTTEQFRSYGPQHHSAIRVGPFVHISMQIDDQVPRGEIKTTKSNQEFLSELEAASREVAAKKKRHNEKLYQNSLECLMSKRVKPNPNPAAEVQGTSSSAKPSPFATPALPKATKMPQRRAKEPPAPKVAPVKSNIFSFVKK